MLVPPDLAQAGFDIPEAGTGELWLWLILGAGIVGLWVIIDRTRKRSYRDYMSRAEREEALKRQDPDLRRPDEDA